MRLNRLIKRSLMIAAVGGMAVTTPAFGSDDDLDDRDRDRARAAAAIAGIAIAGAIVASKKKHDRDRSWDRYERDGNHYYRHDWGATFRPAGTKNTICYRRTRHCYSKGQFSRKWTVREFGYYGG